MFLTFELDIYIGYFCASPCLTPLGPDEFSHSSSVVTIIWSGIYVIVCKELRDTGASTFGTCPCMETTPLLENPGNRAVRPHTDGRQGTATMNCLTEEKGREGAPIQNNTHCKQSMWRLSISLSTGAQRSWCMHISKKLLTTTWANTRACCC